MQCGADEDVRAPEQYWGLYPPGLYKVRVQINQPRGGGIMADFSDQITIPSF